VVGPPVAAIAERRLIDRLLRARAFTATMAVPLTDLPFAEQRRLQRLREQGVIREDTPGAYYLDGPALADHWSHRRHRIAAFAIVLVVIWLVMTALLFVMTGAR
jgi:hypothetical protein